MDIDFILNGKKPKKQKQTKDPLMDLFSMKPKKPTASILGDRVTRSQKRVLKSKNPMDLFGDWDGDGVINGLDCSPRNRKKHMARYLSAKNKVVYGSNQSHYDLDPETYNDEVENIRSQNPMHPYRYSAIRMSSGKEAHSDMLRKSNEQNKIVARIGPSPGFFRNMQNKEYQKKFMKGVSAIESQDKYNDDVSVYNEDGEYIGKKGELKKIYENYEPDSLYESKYIDTKKAYEYRKRSPGTDNMKIHRDSSYEYFKNNKITPIEVDREDYEKGILRDGKHRILAAINKDQKKIQVHIEQDNAPLKEVKNTIE